MEAEYLDQVKTAHLDKTRCLHLQMKQLFLAFLLLTTSIFLQQPWVSALQELLLQASSSPVLKVKLCFLIFNHNYFVLYVTLCSWAWLPGRAACFRPVFSSIAYCLAVLSAFAHRCSVSGQCPVPFGVTPLCDIWAHGAQSFFSGHRSLCVVSKWRVCSRQSSALPELCNQGTSPVWLYILESNWKRGLFCRQEYRGRGLS